MYTTLHKARAKNKNHRVANRHQFRLLLYAIQGKSRKESYVKMNMRDLVSQAYPMIITDINVSP